MGGVAWTEEEDHLLKKCIEQYGEGKWHRVPPLAGLNRCRKSCRLRWLNYLRPNIKRGNFEKEEIDLIVKLQRLLGNRWSLIAGRLPGRTANDVKNYWKCHLIQRLSAQEADQELQADRNSNVEVIGPQPGNFATSSIMKIPSSPDGPNHQQQQQQQPPKEDNGTPLTPTLLQQVQEEDGKGGHDEAPHKEDDYNYLGIDMEDHGFVAELGMDLQFEEVKVAFDVESSISKWDLDDLILDMDLWNEPM